MALPDHHLLLGMTLGAVCATGIGMIAPGWVMSAFAQDQVEVFDANNLAIFKEQPYSVQYEDSVSTDPTGQSTIRKISGGKTSFVHITTTSTGTYSSEALFSPNVLYPGIHVEPLPDKIGAIGVLATWGPDGWTPVSSDDAHSILLLTPQ